MRLLFNFSLILSAVLAFEMSLFAAPQNIQQVQVTQRSGFVYPRFQWDMPGAQGLHFQIVSDGQGAFRIFGITLGAGRTQKNLFLGKNDDSKVYEFVKNIFLGKYEIKAKKNTNPLARTWVTITLFDQNGAATKIPNPVFSQPNLDETCLDLYRYVRSRVQGGDR